MESLPPTQEPTGKDVLYWLASGQVHFDNDRFSLPYQQQERALHIVKITDDPRDISLEAMLEESISLQKRDLRKAQPGWLRRLFGK